MSAMIYKGYTAKVEYDAHDHLFVGRLMGISDIVVFDGSTVEELETRFKESVDHYIEVGEREGLTPQKPCIGTSLEEWFEEKGSSSEAGAKALKEVIAWQVSEAMKKDKISKVEMAKRMNTSRAALDRLLDPENTSVTLQTLSKAAQAVGQEIRIELI